MSVDTRWHLFSLRVSMAPHTSTLANHFCRVQASCFDQCLAVVLSLGIGQFLSVLGNCGINCAACYSCHGREKFRRKYKLPPTFGLPPGLDDCCVHFLCGYCASHQELREAVMRGLDGPGISPLDVWPSSWKHVNGFEKEMEYRKAKLEVLREAGHLFLPFEQRMDQDPGLAVRAGRQLRAYHYKNLGLEVPEHGKGHFHHPRRNYNASKEAKKAAKLGGVPGAAADGNGSEFVDSAPNAVVMEDRVTK